MNPSEAPEDSEGAIRVLVVDDHRVMRAGLVQVLEAWGFAVVGEAGDGIEALEAARRCRPHVVLMDVQMPRMNGIEATRRLRAEFPAVRVVGLSMYDQAKVRADMLAAGASAYLPKCADTEGVCAAIRAAGREAVAAQTPPGKTPPPRDQVGSPAASV